MRKPSAFATLGGIAAAVIVIAAILVRLEGPADPAADVGEQRDHVTRFHELVIDERWGEVFRATSEPPAKTASDFVRLMRAQAREHGEVTGIEIDSMRLLRSSSAPLLEVHEIVTVTQDGAQRTERTVSYYARSKDRWLFAFSAVE